MRVLLHGYGAEPGGEGSVNEIRIWPHDPHRTYWWGYASQLPGRLSGVVHDYTTSPSNASSALVLDSIPADPERVYITGASMWGWCVILGAPICSTFRLRGSNHWSDGRSESSARRITQLTTYWGGPEQMLLGPFGASRMGCARYDRVLSELRLPGSNTSLRITGRMIQLSTSGRVQPSPKTGKVGIRLCKASHWPLRYLG